jgi:hypothetical protein
MHISFCSGYDAPTLVQNQQSLTCKDHGMLQTRQPLKSMPRLSVFQPDAPHHREDILYRLQEDVLCNTGDDSWGKVINTQCDQKNTIK